MNKKTIILSIFIFILVTIIVLLCFLYFDKKEKVENTAYDTNCKMEGLTDEEANAIVENIYQKAIKIYWMIDMFDISDQQVQINSNYYNVINNYEDVVESVFTDNGRKQFESYYKDVLLQKDGITYRLSAERSSNNTYINTIFTKKQKEINKLTFNAKSAYDDSQTGEVKEYKDEIFTIVKNNDKWLIDYFILPN